MRIAWISDTGANLSIPHRMQDSGAEVYTYVHSERHREAYRGMLKERLNTADDLKAWLKDSTPSKTLVIFDGLPRYQGSDEDKAFTRIRKVDPEKLRSSTVFGGVAEYLAKEGFRVVGASKLSEKLEHDAAAGYAVASDVGLEVPEHKEVDGVAEAVATLASPGFEKTRWVVMHPEVHYSESYVGELLSKLRGGWADAVGLAGKFTLARVPDGVAIEEEAWFDGSTFHGLNGALSVRRMMTGSFGLRASTPALSIRWGRRQPFLRWDRLRGGLRQAGYLGPIKATLVLRGGGATLVGWKLSLCDHQTLFDVVRGGPAAWFAGGFTAAMDEDVFAMSALISIPPYPLPVTPAIEGTPIASLAERAHAIDVRVGVRGLECAGTSGAVCVVAGVDNDLVSAASKLRAAIGETKVASEVQVRSDLSELVTTWRNINPRFLR